MDELKVYFGLLQAAHQHHDRRLVGRIATRMGSIRTSISREALSECLSTHSTFTPLNSLFEARTEAPASAPLPTQEAFSWLIALKYLQDHGGCQLELSKAVIQRTAAFNLRELDPILARLIQTHVKAASAQPDAVHNDLMGMLRTCQLRHDYESLSACHNGLARMYMLIGQWKMMDKFFANSPFPSDKASHNQIARHHYYSARLAAIKLHYHSASEHVEQALRKAPAEGPAGHFRLACVKLLIVVRLLSGEVPELSLLKSNRLESTVYYQLCRTVRMGDLPSFQALLSPGSTCAAALQKDALEGLVLRLHQNVLKAGLKRINASYSRISLRDIQLKLGLPAEEDCLMIVMKAIRDQVIDGRVEHDGSVFVSGGGQCSVGQSDAFHARILACQSFVQEAIKAMRYPDASGKAKAVGSPELTPAVDDLDGDDDDMMLMDEDFF